MTTVADLISTTRQQVYGMHRGEYNKLANNISDSATDLSTTYDLRGLAAGIIISIDDELMYVWNVVTSTNALTVERGWLGTTAASHTAGTVIEVSTRFPQVAIRNALLDELRSWPKSLFRIDTYTASIVSSTTAIDLPIDPFYDVIDVRRSSNQSDRWNRVRNYEIDRHADPNSFPSGQALYIADLIDTACNLQIVYSAPFDLDYFDNGIDMQIDCGLEDGMCDIPPIGAAWRLLAPREIKRTFTEAQGEARHAEEVPAGITMQTAAQLKRLRDQRIIEESDRLAQSKAIRW